MPGPNSVVIKYTVSQNCPTIPVHGVYGGVMANGRVVVSLFVDRPGEPEHVKIDADGTQHSPQPSPLREVLARLDLDLPTAHAVGVWLADTARKAGYQPEERGPTSLQ